MLRTALRTALLTALSTGVVATLPAQNCFDLNVGTDLLLSDDGVATALPLGFSFTFAGVAYTDICVCANGYIWLGPVSSGGDFSPTEAELLAGAPRICPLWTDMNPAAAGSGHVYYKTTPGVSATITWAGVYEFGSTNAIELQVVLDSSDNITITYGPTAARGGGLSSRVVIGASPGGGAASNPVTFATRPLLITQDTFAEVFATTGTVPIPISNFQMTLAPTTPGYSVTDSPCTMNSFPAASRFETVGTGCPTPNSITFYEQFHINNNPADLSGTDFAMIPSGASAATYVVLSGAAGPFFTGFTNNLNAGDDTTHPLTLPFTFPHALGNVNDIVVSSNGFLTLGATNPGSGCCTGSVAALLSGPPRIAGHWSDLDASGGISGSGAVYADVDPSTGEFVVTWNQVGESGTASGTVANTFQIALHPNGQINVRLQNVTTVLSFHTTLTGYSDGNGSIDPGPIDISRIGTMPLGPVVVPLSLQAAPGSLPQVGGTLTLDVSGIAPAPRGNFCILLVSAEIPPTPLDGIGLPGCTQFVALPEMGSFLNLPFGAPTTSYSINIPNSPIFYGSQLMSQAVSDDSAANPFGFRVSNGGRWVLGL